jgi:hypothetical protein
MSFFRFVDKSPMYIDVQFIQWNIILAILLLILMLKLAFKTNQASNLILTKERPPINYKIILSASMKNGSNVIIYF